MENNNTGIMEILHNLRRGDLAEKIVGEINKLAMEYGDEEIKLMEVCGTHTVAIFRAGIKSLLPDNICLISGPGCPVCVTSNYTIDQASALACRDDVIFTTYGDMLKVPGSETSLAEVRAGGGDIRVIYSALEALKLAENNPDREVVFMGIGFETTAPATAVAVMEAEKRGIKNFSVLVSHKLVIPVMEALLRDEKTAVDGFICPGHVSTIIGAEAYRGITDRYGVPSVVAGFEPLDILEAVKRLLSQLLEGKAVVENQYNRAVRDEGNSRALQKMYAVFTTGNETWRGLGLIENSGLNFREEWEKYDAVKRLSPQVNKQQGSICPCGEILKGIKLPPECRFFAGECTPEHPIGPCMVSREGSCAVYYKYGN